MRAHRQYWWVFFFIAYHKNPITKFPPEQYGMKERKEKKKDWKRNTTDSLRISLWIFAFANICWSFVFYCVFFSFHSILCCWCCIIHNNDSCASLRLHSMNKKIMHVCKNTNCNSYHTFISKATILLFSQFSERHFIAFSYCNVKQRHQISFYLQ